MRGLAFLGALLLAMGCGDPAVDDVEVGGGRDAGTELPAGDAGNDGPDASAATPFTLDSISPPDQATGVPINAVIVLRFSDPVSTATVSDSSVVVYPCASGPSGKTAGSFRYSPDESEVTFDPASNLVANGCFEVLVKGGTAGVRSGDGRALASDSKSVFRTAAVADTTAPAVKESKPEDGATDVPLDTRISVTFTEAIDVTSLEAGAFELVEWWDGNPQTGPLPGTLDASGNPTIVFVPAANLEVGDQYRMTIAAGIRDAAGNVMANDHSFIFDAAWFRPGEEPKVEKVAPADQAAGVYTTTAVTITFDRRMAQSSVTAQDTVLLYQGADVSSPIAMSRNHYGNPTFVFVPAAALAPNTSYTLRIKGGANGVKDEQQNPMPADFVSVFTTGATADTGPLQVSSIDPASGATGVGQTAPVTVTFNKPVNPASIFLSYTGHTGTFLVSRYADYSFPEKGTLDFTGNPVVKFVLDPSTTYQLDRTYYVKVVGGPQGAKSQSGAPMAADFTSTFTIKSPDVPEGTIDDLRKVEGACAITVKGVYMTFMRDQPNGWKGFFIQKEKSGPAIFVVTGNYKPLFPVHPDPAANLTYPNVDINVTKVGNYYGFKQVLAFSMTRNQAATADFKWVKENLVQVVGDEPLGLEHESEYVQLDGTLTNYQPGASAENREYDLVWGTNRKVKVKISQFGIIEPMKLKVGTKVRIMAPLQKDQKGYFLKPYVFTTENPVSLADLDSPSGWELALDIVKIAP